MAQGAKLRRRNSKQAAKRQKRHAAKAKKVKVGKRRIQMKKKDQKQLNYEVCHSREVVGDPAHCRRMLL